MKKDRSHWTVRKVSFAEAEELDIEYYASIDWKQSAKIVEGMRREIWADAYPGKVAIHIRRSMLKDMKDDLE